jgi:hypothetical protein
LILTGECDLTPIAEQPILVIQKKNAAGPLRSNSDSGPLHALLCQTFTLPVGYVSRKKRPPKWLPEALANNILDPTVGDEVRLLGKEFLEVLDADWPGAMLEEINFKSFVHHVEQAILSGHKKNNRLL